MMKFTYRLAYYLFGLLLGGMFVMFFFQNKKTEFCYLPNCRVLKNIRSKNMEISKEAQAKLDENWVTIDDIRNTVADGEINFSKSKENFKGGKIYFIEGENAKGEPIEVEMVNFENRAYLKGLKKL